MIRRRVMSADEGTQYRCFGRTLFVFDASHLRHQTPVDNEWRRTAYVACRAFEGGRGCYSGRWPHIHFEVYPSLSSSSSVANKVATSQIALPKTACDEVYATSGYESSVTNLSRITLASDNVFSDGAALELATVSGSVSGGLTAALTVAI